MNMFMGCRLGALNAPNYPGGQFKTSFPAFTFAKRSSGLISRATAM